MDIKQSGNFSSHGKRWTDEEEHQLLRELEQNLVKKEIAKNHKRTNGAITARINKIAYEMFIKDIPKELIIRRTKLTEKKLIEIIERNKDKNKYKDKKKISKIKKELKNMNKNMEKMNKNMEMILKLLEEIS